jgi:hypothetical protein
MDASSFTAGADYGIYAATMTGFSGRSTDTSIDIIASPGATVFEADGKEGALGKASNIAGTELGTTDTYYLTARQFNPASRPGAICRYDFYLRVLSGSPIPAMDPNDEDLPPAPRSNGWRCRVIELTTAKDDTFVITVNGSDTIGVIVGVDLERGVPEWNVIAGIGVFTGSFIIAL